MKYIFSCLGIVGIIGISLAQSNFTVQYDFNGVPRTGKYIGDRPDIGAFEYVPVSISSPEEFEVKL